MHHNNGQLTFKEKIALIQQVMLPSVAGFLRTTFKMDKTERTLTLQDFTIPDTIMVKEAIQELENKATPTLYNHSWRTYFWGAAFAKLDQRDFDVETLLTAALFHDIALTEAHIHHKGCKCFTYESALQFEQKAQSIEYDQQKIDLIKDAICLHMNGHLNEQHPAEVILLQQGAACDVIGTQFFRLSPVLQQEVLQHYPREKFNTVFQKLINIEAQQVKNSRTHVLKQLGLPMMIQMNPFKE